MLTEQTMMRAFETKYNQTGIAVWDLKAISGAPNRPKASTCLINWM